MGLAMVSDFNFFGFSHTRRLDELIALVARDGWLAGWLAGWLDK